jgi:hypothetical protein
VFGGLLRLIMRNMPIAKAALVLVPVLLVAAGVWFGGPRARHPSADVRIARLISTTPGA